MVECQTVHVISGSKISLFYLQVFCDDRVDFIHAVIYCSTDEVTCAWYCSSNTCPGYSGSLALANNCITSYGMNKV